MKQIFLALLPAIILCGQEIPPEEMVSETSCCLPMGPRPDLIRIKHLEYQGIGFNQGYSTLELFLSNSEAWKCSNYLFLDLRGHIFNDGKPAFNGGVGWRYLFDSLCNAVGANAYYDYRKTKHRHYNQFGFGLEYLSPRWEARANGYFPVGSRVSQLYDLKFDHFEGNQLFVSRKHEFAMTGGDAEVGYHFARGEYFDLYAGVGPYYFKGHLGKSAVGGKARIEARITPYFSIEVGDSYDQVFRNRFHAEAAVSIPFGPRSRPNGEKCCSCDDQIALQKWLHDAPNRNEIVVVDTKKKTSNAIDPGTGLPLFFIFVNNTSSSNGTFESPYPLLASAGLNSKPGDVIYVFPGDGTDLGMDEGIALKMSQKLLGAGISHSFLTTLGTVDVPQQAIGLPHISNAASLLDVVTVENNNEVSGFFIQQINSLNGISASPAFGNNTLITRNIIQVENDGIGVFLQGNPFMGNVNISNNIFLGADTSDTFGVDFFLAEEGNIYIANNLFTGVDSTTGLSKGVDFFHTQNFSATVINNIFSSVTSNGVIPHAIGVDPFTTQDTFFLDLRIIGNQINLPSTLVGLIGGVVVKDEAGEGPFTITLQNNNVVTPAGIPGYLFDNMGTSSEMMIRFNPNNTGTLQINGLVDLLP